MAIIFPTQRQEKEYQGKIALSTGVIFRRKIYQKKFSLFSMKLTVHNVMF